MDIHIAILCNYYFGKKSEIINLVIQDQIYYFAIRSEIGP